jgi:hypothetical protein
MGHNFEDVFSPNSIYAKTELVVPELGAYGTISDANRESMLQVCSIWLLKMWEYSGIETSSKCLYRFCLGEEII